MIDLTPLVVADAKLVAEARDVPGGFVVGQEDALGLNAGDVLVGIV